MDVPRGIPITPDQLREAVRLQNQLWTQDRIADRLGLHHVAVCRALARHNRRALARIEKRTAAVKAKQVGQLETVASEAFDAWLHSKTPRTVTRRTDSDGPGGPAEAMTEEVSTHQCDAALLNQARGALADVRKILGLDAPVQAQIEDRRAQPGTEAMSRAAAEIDRWKQEQIARLSSSLSAPPTPPTSSTVTD
jgi:hypothetical protein